MADIVVEDGTGLAAANSYCSVDTADVYHEAHLHATDWTGATESVKETALVWATRLLDEMVNWNGYKTSQEQALAWPRNLVYDREGYGIATDVIPSWLAQATAEFARLLIAEDRTAETNRGLVGFSNIKVGDLSLTTDSYVTKPVMPPSVWSMVRFYGTRIGRRKTLVRI